MLEETLQVTQLREKEQAIFHLKVRLGTFANLEKVCGKNAKQERSLECGDVLISFSQSASLNAREDTIAMDGKTGRWLLKSVLKQNEEVWEKIQVA